MQTRALVYGLRRTVCKEIPASPKMRKPFSEIAFAVLLVGLGALLELVILITY